MMMMLMMLPIYTASDSMSFGERWGPVLKAEDVIPEMHYLPMHVPPFVSSRMIAVADTAMASTQSAQMHKENGKSAFKIKSL